MTDFTLEKEGDAFDYDETPENYLEVLAEVRKEIAQERRDAQGNG
jgi:hypothetical protein